MNEVVIHIHGTVAGIPTKFDGEYVAEYDPMQYPDNIIRAHLVTTPDPKKAWRGTVAEAHALWARSRGTRPWDGKPDRPLTAFTVSLEPAL